VHSEGSHRTEKGKQNVMAFGELAESFRELLDEAFPCPFRRGWSPRSSIISSFITLFKFPSLLIQKFYDSQKKDARAGAEGPEVFCLFLVRFSPRRLSLLFLLLLPLSLSIIITF
jgi:hypothetical protein